MFVPPSCGGRQPIFVGGKLVTRIFARGIESGDYGLKEEWRKLKDAPRVIKAGHRLWHASPGHWNKVMVAPSTAPPQTIYIHVVDLPPGGHNQKHGHQNEALFYILEGKGHEVHDGQRYDWEAGDVVIVHNDCVHQHFNDSPDRPARAVVIKPKPLYMFLNLIQQRTVERVPKQDKSYLPPEHSPDK
ncbi:MAG: cupin domain-containing protein [Chloroflexi bacterium]|nr:cupin domain-containing protein [Chloroflexota bacterium]